MLLLSCESVIDVVAAGLGASVTGAGTGTDGIITDGASVDAAPPPPPLPDCAAADDVVKLCVPFKLHSPL